MKLFEKQQSGRPLYYLEVASNYFDETDAKGMNDAVSFLMGQYADADLKEHEIDQLLCFSTEEARKFAEYIVSLCDRIDQG